MNIGLFPMSGIRVCDTELLRLGLTLPGFVERSKTIASLPSLGLLTLAGMTPAEHRIHYLEIPDLARQGSLPGEFDLVAISSYSAQMNEAYDLARRYESMGVPVVMGGLHVTALPEEALEHCSAVVVGEGEACWPEVLGDAAAGRLKPVYDGGAGDFDLADAPMPAFELLDIDKYNRLTVQTSRGCPHRCEFCASSVLLCDRYKQKPVARVLAEIDRIRTIWEQPFLEFADDNSIVNRAYWKELLGELKARRLRWFAETDLTVSEDGELLDLMRESGCLQVLVGLESPVETGLPGLELKSDWKRARFPRYREAIRTIQAHGITVNGCFVIGLDGHTPEIFDQVFDFVKESELYEVQITIATPFPGTPFYDRLAAAGRLLEPPDWRARTLFDLTFRPSAMEPAELVDGFKRLAAKIYSEEFTAWRKGNFKRKHAARRQREGGST